MRSHSRSQILARRLAPALGATLLLLPGCGGGVEGTYSMTDKESGMEMSVELANDDEARVTLKGDANSMTSSGTYRKEGDQVTLTIDGDATVFTLEDDKLTGRFFGDSLVLVKQ